MFSLRKNKQLMDLMEDFFATIESTLAKTLLALRYVIKHDIDNRFEVMVEEIGEAERNADNTCKAIEHKMFLQSLLPETREDLLEIIEEMDNIADTCKRLVYIISDQQVTPLPKIKKDIMELTKVGIKCYKYTLDAVHDFLGKMKEMETITQKIDNYEHVGDKLERKMIRTIFFSKVIDARRKADPKRARAGNWQYL